MFSLAGGLRGLYGDAKVQSRGQVAHGGITASRYMEGNTWEWGYNLALSARPVKEMNLSVTYRSNVNLDLEGNAELATSLGPSMYNGPGEVSVPVPAVLALAGSYTFFDQLTTEFTFERIFWSKYEQLDFNYPVPLGNPVLIGAFDSPKTKDWEDSNTYRLGLTYDTQKSFILMAGCAYDETPIPDATLGFDLPDSKSYIYSLGVRYLATKQFELGLGYLYVHKKDRTAKNPIINGDFTGSRAHVLSGGLAYKF
jgi:long-chain fatty acid transport protein